MLITKITVNHTNWHNLTTKELAVIKANLVIQNDIAM